MITKPIIPVVVMVPLLLIVLVIYSIGAIRRSVKIRYKVLAILRITIIVVLAFLVNLRIMEKKYDAKVEMKNLDVLFVVDTTISMWAEDGYGSGTRMDSVQKDAEYIIDQLSGSNFGLIRFDNRSQILAPFTQDHESVKDAFSTIKEPDINYARGSSLNVCYDDMKSLLDSSNAKDERLTIVFFISDGEITDGSTLQSFAELNELVDAGAVLGYGTSNGAEMAYGSWGSKVQDPETGKNAISKLDEVHLKSIAEDLDVDYIHMKGTSNLTYLLESIKSGSSLTVEKSDTVTYEDTYFRFVIPLLIMLMIEMVLFIRRGRL
ncbi:MAG: VWA domain-containing protein [Eubacterium sp.]|jgi:Ca-activated chloride channel family protein|nr:VWA domain-containing protein [Eubacterium sp.]MBQ2054498.1 VWA domain-containing protein [Eubacterium sp.]